MHLLRVLVPLVLATSAVARDCYQWDNAENKAKVCYWESCGRNDHNIGYVASDGGKLSSRTKDFSAAQMCNPQSEARRHSNNYRNFPSDDCCEAYGDWYFGGCTLAWEWSDLWCYTPKK